MFFLCFNFKFIHSKCIGEQRHILLCCKPWRKVCCLILPVFTEVDFSNF